MQDLSKKIIFISQPHFCEPHKKFMEEKGAIIHCINDLKELEKHPLNNYDLIIIEYFTDDLKAFIQNKKDFLKSSNLIIITENSMQKENLLQIFPEATILTKPLSAKQLNEEASQRLCIPYRIPIKILARMQLLEDQSIFALGTVTNLSINGLLLETEKKIEIGTSLKLSFYLASSGGYVEVYGKVMRISPSSSPKFSCYGIKFTKVESNFLEKIKKFVEKIKSQR